MKRRNFLGFLGGAAVAGPSMAKQAVTQTMSDLHLPGIAGGATGIGSSGPMEVYPGVDIAHQTQRFAKWQLLKLDPAWLSRKRRERWLDGLDPDLASYRSFSLSAKIHMQRDRNFERWVLGQDSWFERVLSGAVDTDDF